MHVAETVRARRTSELSAPPPSKARVIHVDQHDHGSTAIRTNARVDNARSLSAAATVAVSVRRSSAAGQYSFFPLDYTQLYQRLAMSDAHLD